MLGGLRRDAGGGSGGMLLQGEGFRGMLQGGGANTDPSAPPAQQSWALWDAEGHPPLTKDAYHPWGRTTPLL